MNPYDLAERHLVAYGGHRNNIEGRELIVKALRFLRSKNRIAARSWARGLKSISGQFPIKAEASLKGGK